MSGEEEKRPLQEMEKGKESSIAEDNDTDDNSWNQQKILGCKRDHNEQIKKNLPPQLDEPNIPNETGEM